MADAPETKAPGGLAQRAVTGVILALIVLTIIWLPATVKLPAIDHLIPAAYTFESLHLTVHRHPKFSERFHRVPHGFPIGPGAHDHTHQRQGVLTGHQPSRKHHSCSIFRLLRCDPVAES